MRRFLLSMSMIFLGTPLQAMTLEEAVASAIDTNPDIQQQYARYQSSLSLQQSARGEYLPQVRLTAGYGPEETRFKSGQDLDAELDRGELGLSISQLLFNGFKTQAEVERLGQEAASERFTLISLAENTALQVCKLYLDLMKTEGIAELAKKNVQDHMAAMEDIRHRVSKGLSSESDLSQVSARLASARASMLAANNNLYDTRASFVRWVGQEPSSLIDPVSDSKLKPTTLVDALERAKSNHPELDVARSDISAAQEERRIAEHSFYPKVYLELVANDNDDVGGFEGPDENGRIMLKMEYDIYNGGRDKNLARASGWRYNEAMAIYKRSYREVEEGTKLAWNAQNFISRQVDVFKQNVDAATATHAGYVQQFRLGRRTLLDVLDAQVELFVARRNYITAKYDNQYANYRLNNALGTLIYSLRVDYPEQWGESGESRDPNNHGESE